MMAASVLRRSHPRIARFVLAALGAAAFTLSVTILGSLSGCAPGPYDLGRRALDQGDPRAAEQYFDQALEAGDRSFEAQRERGAARLAAGDLAGARADLESLAGQRPDDTRLLWLLGQTHGQLEDHVRAAQAYRRYEQLTRDPRAREAAQVRVAQLERTITVTVADSLLEERRGGRAPEPNILCKWLHIERMWNL